MWNWLASNSAMVNVVLNSAMLVVWITYLQLIYVSFRRSTRAVIHIDMAAGADQQARCIVTNMGADTVYILGIKVDLSCEGGYREALVTDHLEQENALGGDFRERTAKGPLAGGEAVDLGTFANILKRAAQQKGESITAETCHSIEITVVVAAQQAHRLMGGYKRFDVLREGDSLRFRSPDVLTRQVTGWLRRKRLLNEIGN
ncbi:hypothetical protein [Mameliella sp.]|uniref:hypothetical protein n=1 Tax=Mameliella sp. TaxID=1924940 RepID=UPI003B50F05C